VVLRRVRALDLPDVDRELSVRADRLAGAQAVAVLLGALRASRGEGTRAAAAALLTRTMYASVPPLVKKPRTAYQR